ncbi:PREDICTED: long-chain fatty acid transport protein 4-like [Diuraphis noxia]|uniref:long-chain fatty acid transport protein 4-like n=1 Tax=Diuraphis noxia TaxID=143948 RepID=UPI000763BA04|nr:PREDICTED: long-chain fatty acid transport protein 4-like [Diuraphis noxia]
MKTTDKEWDVEKGLPRGVAAGLSGGGDDDDDDDDHHLGGCNPNALKADNCCDNAVTEVIDGVHGKQQQQQRIGGGDDSKSTTGGGGSGGGRVRGVVCAAVKVIVVAAAFTVTCAFVWYTMGLPFLLQVVVVATIAFVASGGYKFVYLVYRTAPRDLRALFRYYYFLYTAKKLGKKNWTVADVFKHKVVKNTPHKVLFVFEDKEWTALQVEEYSNKVANVMLDRGFKKGDVVGLLMENRPEFVGIWLGMSKVGIVSALINYNQRMVSLVHSIKVANCTSLIYGAELSSNIDDIKGELDNDIKLFKFSSTTPPVNDGTYLNHFLDKASPSAPNPPEKPGYNDKLLYIYTSGTTGYPKAAIITNVRYIFIAGAYAYQVGLKYSDRFYTPMPLYHTAAGIMCIGQSLLYGCTTVIRKKFSASGYFQDISKYNCTAAQYIGEMCRYILATPPKADDTNHKLRIIFGNGLKPQIWKEFVSRFNVPRVAEFYGSTEGNANIANTDNTFGAIGFVSRLIPSIYPISIIRVNPETCEPIRNADGLCTRCNPGEPGVIVGKIISTNPSRQFLGYVNNEESKKKIVRDVFDKGDAAFLSGDLLVSDEWGYLYFKDRTGDTFRWKGENVSTAEVEGVVSNIAGYRDCVVYGVEVPNSEGRAGMAAIVDKDNTLDVSTLSDGLQKALPSYARPLFIRKLNEVEMTGTYKLKKLDLQKDGYDIDRIKDQVYYCNSKGIYQELTIEAYTDIISGKIRL